MRAALFLQADKRVIVHHVCIRQHAVCAYGVRVSEIVLFKRVRVARVCGYVVRFCVCVCALRERACVAGVTRGVVTTLCVQMCVCVRMV